MTATATPPNPPTDEQLREYAAQLPDLYKDILAAFQYADPSRDRGDGLFEESLANFLWNEAAHSCLTTTTTTTQPPTTGWEAMRASRYWGMARRYRFTQSVYEFNSEEFSAAIDHLVANGFIQPRTADATGRLVPTDVGERLIEIVAGKPPPANKVPDLPKPTWR